jgi:hypothetical protein
MEVQWNKWAWCLHATYMPIVQTGYVNQKCFFFENHFQTLKTILTPQNYFHYALGILANHGLVPLFIFALYQV